MRKDKQEQANALEALMKQINPNVTFVDVTPIEQQPPCPECGHPTHEPGKCTGNGGVSRQDEHFPCLCPADLQPPQLTLETLREACSKMPEVDNWQPKEQHEPADTWCCTECGKENEPDDIDCEQCGYPRDGKEVLSLKPAEMLLVVSITDANITLCVPKIAKQWIEAQQKSDQLWHNEQKTLIFEAGRQAGIKEAAPR